MKKLLLTLGAFGFAIAVLPMVAAFEAHVINVTARIENALQVSTDAIDFGTVFPQEELDAPVEVALSQSFLDEDRVDDVEYFIRQKPKCAYTWNDGQNADLENTATGHVSLNEVDVPVIDCGDAPRPPRDDADLEQAGIQTETWGVLPMLCPYLSKHKGEDGLEVNETELDAFHQPWTFAGHQIVWTDTFGYLTKAGNDTVDHWNIDLKVPCFGDHCAQDWDDFVTGINPNASSTDYIQPIENEHKVFGCDLWIEVSGVSTSTEEVLPVCGNAVVEAGETCDDGAFNGTPTNCNLTCDGTTPAVCGNSITEAGEQCDDGNTVSNDGCSAICETETPAVCGNNVVESGEQCDDGNTTTESCAYGLQSCQVCGNTCQEVSGAVSYCGDAVTDAGNGETCDDGVFNGTPTNCNLTCNGTTPAVCGNNITEAGEQCDDGNTANLDGCSATCQVETPVCGNGVVESGEQCDDNNLTNGDGCSAQCTTTTQCADGVDNDVDGLTDFPSDPACTDAADNDESPVNQTTLISASFGVGATDGTFDEAPAWTETGTGGEQRAAGSGNDTASPDGDRFAALFPFSTICMNVNSTGLQDMLLKYYWRGDVDAEDGDSAFVQYRANGNCNSAGWTTLATHELDDGDNNVDEDWSALQSVALPASLDNDGSWFIRFINLALQSSEDFRVDGVLLTATSI